MTFGPCVVLALESLKYLTTACRIVARRCKKYYIKFNSYPLSLASTHSHPFSKILWKTLTLTSLSIWIQWLLITVIYLFHTYQSSFKPFHPHPPVGLIPLLLSSEDPQTRAISASARLAAICARFFWGTTCKQQNWQIRQSVFMANQPTPT